MRKYHKAPLPFLGQKRNWLKTIYEINFDNKIIVDLFGGSGILSHEIKRNHPTATVVWNDFDDYRSRLEQIEKTERLRQQLFSFDLVVERNKRIDDIQRWPYTSGGGFCARFLTGFLLKIDI